MDIGGVTLLRAAAKNYERVTVVSDPGDYPLAIEALRDDDTPVSLSIRKRLALKVSARVSFAPIMAQAFEQTARYDTSIATFVRGNDDSKLVLRYGMNPHQTAASIATTDGAPLPLTGASINQITQWQS